MRYLDPDDHGAPWPRRQLSAEWRRIAGGWIVLAIGVVAFGYFGIVGPNGAMAAARKGAKVGKVPDKRPATPDQTRASSMVKVTLVTLNNAVLTKNFSILRSQSARAFKRKYSSARLRRAFAPFIKQKVDLAPALNLSPVWTTAPQVDPDGELRLLGWFRTRPRVVRFDLRYVHERGRWRLSMIEVDTTKPAKE